MKNFVQVLRNGLPDVIQYVDLCRSVSNSEACGGWRAHESIDAAFPHHNKQRTGSGTCSLPETQPVGKIKFY